MSWFSATKAYNFCTQLAEQCTSADGWIVCSSIINSFIKQLCGTPRQPYFTRNDVWSINLEVVRLCMCIRVNLCIRARLQGGWYLRAVQEISYCGPRGPLLSRDCSVVNRRNTGYIYTTVNQKCVGWISKTAI